MPHPSRPGHHLAPNRCFGTKRAVQTPPQDSTLSVRSPRRAQPGLQTTTPSSIRIDCVVR
ncbi:hypothetical protein CEE69_20110 [Rhodopirellula bahusiensis]|uniref:Uncharacterized protein n=1 Tax=Rhodopirellula bahusiensis TaxID=2014065 RepID=A0A2G1W3L2_9BACT|nr:hypothetical protein CEE69_20110 [Rhodopirellula bahusiensis]